MASPTRFPSGVTNVASTSDTGMLGMPDPTRFHTFFDDFDRYTAADWVIQTVETGTGSATEALTDGDGGLFLITNDDADNDADFFQTIAEGFLMEAGKPAWFKCRFKVSNATQSDVVFGLQIRDTTPLDVTDGIYFLKADDATSISLICRKNATTGSTSVAVGNLADDTYITLGWYYDGVDSVKGYVNDVHAGTVSATSDFLPDTELTVSFGVQNGSAGAKTMTVDYVYAAKKR